MIRKSGIGSWPPQWQAVDRNVRAIEGEVGILEDVSMHDSIANKIFLAVQHRHDRHIAVLAFDDTTFVQQLYRILLKHIGRSVKEIGDLDLSHLL
jgi:hypothetical protein